MSESTSEVKRTSLPSVITSGANLAQGLVERVSATHPSTWWRSGASHRANVVAEGNLILQHHFEAVVHLLHESEEQRAVLMNELEQVSVL